jgi:hypothetical protein
LLEVVFFLYPLLEADFFLYLLLEVVFFLHPLMEVNSLFTHYCKPILSLPLDGS